MPVDFFVLICDRLADKNHAAGRFDRNLIKCPSYMAEYGGLTAGDEPIIANKKAHDRNRELFCWRLSVRYSL